MNLAKYLKQVKLLKAGQCLQKNLKISNNNRGSGIIEYLAMAAFILAILSAVMLNSAKIGDQISGQIQQCINLNVVADESTSETAQNESEGDTSLTPTAVNVIEDKGTSGTAQKESEGDNSVKPAAATKAADKDISGIAQNKSDVNPSLRSTAVDKVLDMGTSGTVQNESAGDNSPQADQAKTPPSVTNPFGRDMNIPGVDPGLDNSKTIATGPTTTMPPTSPTQVTGNANINTGTKILNVAQNLVKGFVEVQSLVRGSDEVQNLVKVFNVVESFGGGVGEAGISAISGVGHMVMHPIITVQAIGTAVAHPILTGQAIGNSVSKAYTEQVVNGDSSSKARFFGRAIGEVGLSVVGTKGLDKVADLSKVGEAAKAANVLSKTGKVKKVAGEVAEGLGDAGNSALKSGINQLEPYLGVRQASDYLKLQRVPRAIRKQVLESFDVRTIYMDVANENTFGIRFHDYGVYASPKGRYLYETFQPLASREGAAIKREWNNMNGVKQWKVEEGSKILKGKAAPQIENGIRYEGGIEQWWIKDINNIVEP